MLFSSGFIPSVYSFLDSTWRWRWIERRYLSLNCICLLCGSGDVVWEGLTKIVYEGQCLFILFGRLECMRTGCDVVVVLMLAYFSTQVSS